MVISTFKIVQDWGSGFEGEITLVNNGLIDVNNWLLEFSADFSINSLWNADLVSFEQGKYLIRHSGWNRDLEIGETITIGFIANSFNGDINSPSNFILNGSPLDATQETLPQLSINDVVVTEGNEEYTYLTYTVTLNQPSENIVTVNYNTQDIDAIASSDYDYLQGILTFLPGEQKKTITVKVKGDLTFEEDETLILNLSNPVGANISDNQGLGTIINDDSPKIDDNSENNPIKVEFIIESQWSTGFTGSIKITNQSQDPINGWQLQFNSPFEIVSLWNGEKNQLPTGEYLISNLGWNALISPDSSISFGFTGNYLGENISSPTNYIFNNQNLDNGGQNQDDDDSNQILPSLSISDLNIQEGNQGQNEAIITILLSTHSNQTITVSYQTLEGSALAGQDYQAKTGTVTFEPGVTTQTISIPIYGDTQWENNETFQLELFNVNNASITDSQGVVTILNDDLNNNNENNDYIVGAYYPEWAIYDRNFQVEDIPGDKLTHIFYAFAKIDNDGEVDIFDPWAATQTTFGGKYTWEQSSSGEAGNFAELQALKVEYPHLKNMISIGGWTLSGLFSDVALTPESREKFATSAVEFMIKYGFDGIDIDWEYPVSGGLDSNIYRPEDKQNYTLLLQELRQQLDWQSTIDGKKYELSIASPAGEDKIVNYDLAQMSEYLDFFNVMTYDYHGAWENQTNHQSALYSNPNDPSSLKEIYNIDYTIQQYLNAGVNPKDIVLGAPIYGRSWTGVPNYNDGLFQNATNAGPGTWENGVFDYKDLYNKVNDSSSGYQRFWDDTAKVAYVYNSSLGVFSTYEDKQSLHAKLDYLKEKELGGIFFWEASADLESNHPDSLINIASTQLIN
ncbi:glycosyl hydrolase family 18 protein [Cyanobacterium aponinum UTEX 3221]|uniref:glycosyl hydrolase family 18 protein n=1 Tax=Cyanobacterium aponinum TaxID=379064 RepID=UPI002B4BA57F|nr:glycosyl hydrolase family 18 protein [Cyanobacterium aponinum]WRL36825.1 glycosyl hydrolase family 18 protein [Cyanobacterium aponinum UTEX 3221]